jgi:hypothetical protein
MIRPHNNETQTQWDRGELQVMLKNESTDRPIGFCDGTVADEEEILEQAMLEGSEVEIHKKSLKTGREIWTVKRLDRRPPEEWS